MPPPGRAVSGGVALLGVRCARIGWVRGVPAGRTCTTPWKQRRAGVEGGGGPSKWEWKERVERASDRKPSGGAGKQGAALPDQGLDASPGGHIPARLLGGSLPRRV
jgi:hypothetical protein